MPRNQAWQKLVKYDIVNSPRFRKIDEQDFYSLAGPTALGDIAFANLDMVRPWSKVGVKIRSKCGTYRAVTEAVTVVEKRIRLDAKKIVCRYGVLPSVLLARR